MKNGIGPLGLAFLMAWPAVADFAPGAKNVEVEREVEIFLVYPLHTEKGRAFQAEMLNKRSELTAQQKRNLAGVMKLLKQAEFETPKLVEPAQQNKARKVARNAVELWAPRYSTYGEKAENAMHDLLNGIDERHGKSRWGVLVVMEGVESLLTKDQMPEPLDVFFKTGEVGK